MNTNDSVFYARCYEILKQVPPGEVTTYSEIAKALNSKAWQPLAAP